MLDLYSVSITCHVSPLRQDILGTDFGSMSRCAVCYLWLHNTYTGWLCWRGCWECYLQTSTGALATLPIRYTYYLYCCVFVYTYFPLDVLPICIVVYLYILLHDNILPIIEMKSRS